jgi:kynurenine formamidase
LHPQTAKWILDNRGMAAIGIDTVSYDAGNIVDWANSVHTVCGKTITQTQNCPSSQSYL